MLDLKYKFRSKIEIQDENQNLGRKLKFESKIKFWTENQNVRTIWVKNQMLDLEYKFRAKIKNMSQ